MCALTNNFINWIEVSSEELEFMCLKEAKRNFHARLSSIVEPLLQKVPPTPFLPVPEVIPPPSPEQMTLATSEMTPEVASVSRVKKTLVYEEIILKALEDLKVENHVVRNRLDKQVEMFKFQIEKTIKIEGMHGVILSRLPPHS